MKTMNIKHEGMERLSASWEHRSGSGTTKDIVEQAKEELEILEAQQPNRFDYLKHELKFFISHVESQSLLFSCANSTFYPISSSVTTQESSAGKKRKKSDSVNEETVEGNYIEASKHKFQRVGSDGCCKRRGRIDVVVERAQECLQKIQQFKTSFS